MSCTTSPTAPLRSSHDIRSPALEAKRFRDNKAKWARGLAPSPSGKLTSSGTAFHRPISQHKAALLEAYTDLPRYKPLTSKIRTSLTHDAESERYRVTGPPEEAYDRVDNQDELDAALSAEVAYSFDNRGPQAGSQILSAAVTQAVERFEVKETERLVRNEYDVVRGDEERLGAGGPVIEDEGFELL